jgi:hypothetical protein
MSRDVCGICWCPYDDDGRCGCEHTPLVRDDTDLLRQALYLIEAWERGAESADYWFEIAALRERLK